MLSVNPRAVRDFFGMDSDGNGKPDTGMAFTVVQYFKPYVSEAKREGIITVKVDSNKSRVESLKKDIEKKKEHLKKYAANLRIKFTNMEISVGRSKATGKYLNQRFRTGDK